MRVDQLAPYRRAIEDIQQNSYVARLMGDWQALARCEAAELAAKQDLRRREIAVARQRVLVDWH